MPIPAVIFPDVELWAATYLRGALAAHGESGMYVSNTTPNPRRSRMVIVRRDGGPRLDIVRETARIGVNVWGDSEQDATDLARLVAALMWASPDGDPVVRVIQPTGATPVADSSGQPLRYMTFEVTVRGSDLP